ncbi:MAG: tetratricopeptide repeat protein [Candidatus Neomarinimicrobiota bacterium]|nr:tetratricopeptide repeat protein [Candidatus Neomarinimicrobiota bacterium]
MIRLLAFLFYLGVLFGQDKGKKAYEEGHYDEARVYYEHVLKNRKKDDGAQFGLGVTAYQQKDMETAARALNNAMNSDDKSLASKAMYNLGNMFRDQQKMEESFALYRKAIELDPTDEDAKVNYELLKHVLKQQEQRQQEDKQNQEQDQEKQDQQKQNQDSEGQDEQNKNQDNQEKGEDQQEDQQKSQSEKEEEKKEQQQSQAKQDETQDQKTDKQMQAEAILNALKDQEKINQKRQIAKSKSRKLEKDW